MAADKDTDITFFHKLFFFICLHSSRNFIFLIYFSSYKNCKNRNYSVQPEALAAEGV